MKEKLLKKIEDGLNKIYHKHSCLVDVAEVWNAVIELANMGDETPEEHYQLNLRPFTESDWDAFAGALGRKPLISYNGLVDAPTFELLRYDSSEYSSCLIVDQIGIEINIWCDPDDEAVAIYRLDCNQNVGELVANSLDLPLNYNQLKKLGFERVD